MKFLIAKYGKRKFMLIKDVGYGLTTGIVFKTKFDAIRYCDTHHLQFVIKR